MKRKREERWIKGGVRKAEGEGEKEIKLEIGRQLIAVAIVDLIIYRATNLAFQNFFVKFHSSLSHITKSIS